MLTGLFFAVSGYLLGSILFASIISKLFHKDIISKSPDKNYGTANAFRYGGVLCGALTLLCDMGKGFLPVFIYMHTENPSEVMLPIVLVAPVIGHILPIFSKFKGGKAIAVTFGSLAGMWPNWTTVLLLYSVYDADKDNPSLLLHYYFILLYNACIVLYRACEGGVDRYAYDNYCLLDKDAQRSRRT